MPVDIVSFAYATAITFGGVIGYVKAGSVVSLGAGVIFGGVLTYGAFLTSQNPQNYFLTLGTSAVLLGVMGMRFYTTGKVMPAGIVTLLSLGMVVRLGARYLGLHPA